MVANNGFLLQNEKYISTPSGAAVIYEEYGAAFASAEAMGLCVPPCIAESAAHRLVAANKVASDDSKIVKH